MGLIVGPDGGNLTPDDVRVPHIARRIAEQFRREELITGRYRCDGCGFVNGVAVMPWTPKNAKHKCSRCDRVNEVVTKADSIDQVAEWFEEGKDVKETAKRKSVSVHRETDLVRGKLIEGQFGR